MSEALEHACFLAYRTLGRLLRGGRYATTRIVQDTDVLRVHKRRRVYAPLLVAMGGPLMRTLDTGVRVLPQRAWEERERSLYRMLHGAEIRVDDVTLVLPHLVGATLAELLGDRQGDAAARARAIRLAAAALRALHDRDITHGDAMAENVMVDLDRDVARWFDFETVHDETRPLAWRRADDVRALLATCLLRVDDEATSATLDLVLDTYADQTILAPLAAHFSSGMRRPLVFHLGQAGLSFRRFRAIGALLRSRGA